MLNKFGRSKLTLWLVFSRNFVSPAAVVAKLFLLKASSVAMKVSGLAKLWESDEMIREQLRTKKKLCVHPASQRYCEPSRPNAVANRNVLLPALKVLGETPKWTLPHLDPLQEELGALFSRVGIEPDEDQVYKSSIEVKKLLGFVKRRAVRNEVTKARAFSNQSASC